MSLTTTDKHDIKVMIREGTAHLASTSFVKKKINRLELLMEDNSTKVSRLEVLMEDNSTKISRLEVLVEDNSTKIDRSDVLIEDVSHRVNAILEIVSVFAGSNQKLENHEVRLEEIESKQPLIIDTLKLHSKQLGN